MKRILLFTIENFSINIGISVECRLSLDNSLCAKLSQSTKNAQVTIVCPNVRTQRYYDVIKAILYNET